MRENFGAHIKRKRKERSIKLLHFAGALDISSGYLHDVENGRRSPFGKDKLYKVAEILELNKEESEYLYDLAARERDEVSADLVDYIMGNETIRTMLRIARDKGLTDKDWEEIMHKMVQKERKADK